MVCNKCGQQNNDGSMFCYSCGSLIESTQQGNGNQAPMQGNANQSSMQGRSNQSSMQGNSNQVPKQEGMNYKNAQATVGDAPVTATAPAYNAPAATAPAYNAPAASAPAYNAPAASAPAYNAPAASTPAYSAPAASAPAYTSPAEPSAPAYANPPVYPTTGGKGVSTPANPGLGMAIAGMICGICSILSLYIGMIPGALGIIFGAIAKNNGSENPMATAGIVCGAIGTFLSLIWVVICAVAIS